MSSLSVTSQLKYQSYAKQLRILYQKPVAQVSTGLILTLLTAAFFGFAAIRPTLTTVSNLIREIEEKKEVEEKLQKKIQSLVAVEQEYNTNLHKIAWLDIAIPSLHNLSNLLLQIEYLCWTSQTPLDSLRVEPIAVYPEGVTKSKTDSKDSFPSMLLTLNVVANDRQHFYQLLQSLDNLERILRIESISYSDSKNEAFDFQMSVAVRAYFSSSKTTEVEPVTTTDQ